MKKADALKIIIKSAELYRENLENRNFLFISLVNKVNLNFIEVKFHKSNFKHLTGVVIPNEKISATQFYKKCLNHKLSLYDFELRTDGTTELKLSVLPQLMNINKSVKMIGDFNNYRPKLYIGKLAGNITACIGLNKDDEFYVPATSLKEDIRGLVVKTEKVIAIFSKRIEDELYTDLTYLSKDFNGIEISRCPKAMLKKLNVDNISDYQGLKFMKDALDESAVTVEE